MQERLQLAFGQIMIIGCDGLGNHSLRSATIGSTDAARRAGM
jgi:hypothetical protein